MEAVSPRCIVDSPAPPHNNIPKMSGEGIEARAVDATADATSNNGHDGLREDNGNNNNNNNNEFTSKEDTQPHPNHNNDSNIHSNIMANNLHHPPNSPPVVENHYYVYPHVPQSPARVSGGYDVQALLMQQHAGRQHYNSVLPPPPLTPPTAIVKETMERTNISMGIIPPASPLFTTYSMEQQMEARGLTPQSPATYLAAHPPQAVPTSPGFLYQGYGAAMSPYGTTAQGDNIQNSNLSPDQKRIAGWNERSGNQHQPMYPNTPTQSTHLPTHMLYPGISTRGHAASFDEMLPPPTIKEFAESSPIAGGEGATLFTHQNFWGGYNNSGDLYSPATLSPHLQQPHREMGIPPHAANSRNFHSFYPPTTPGPPIQMTPHNKGPDGANLFIFHIPNHFTNLDMYNLFCHYGTLLSVRIMVEKDTGRSRGFGFVSYDTPDAAAMAIKELNGFVIGNKRLKVQHKQIRASDQNYHGGGNHESQQVNSHNTSNKVGGQMPIMSDGQTMAPSSTPFANFQGDETQSSSIQNESEGIHSDNTNSATTTNPMINVRDASPLSNLDHMKEALSELPK